MRCFAFVDRAHRDLNTGDLEGDVIVGEDQE